MKVFALFLLVVSMPIGALAQKEVKPAPKPPSAKELKKQSENASLKIPTGASFFIAPITDNPNHFSLLLGDADNRTVADSFTLAQIELFQSVMVEAQKFAENNEAAGTVDAPKITRFYDKKEPAIIVDVEKAGMQTRIFVTLSCLTGHITVEAGTFKRDGKEHQTPFSNFISRIQTVKTIATTPQD